MTLQTQLEAFATHATMRTYPGRREILSQARPGRNKAVLLGSGIHVFPGNGSGAARRPETLAEATSAPMPSTITQEETEPQQSLFSEMPPEVWLLILAWSGLRNSAVATTCSSCLRHLHRIIIATPQLLARALLADHGPAGAAAHLYGSMSGGPHPQHAVNSDVGISTVMQELLLLARPADPTACASAAAALSAVFASASSSSTTFPPLLPSDYAPLTNYLPIAPVHSSGTTHPPDAASFSSPFLTRQMPPAVSNLRRTAAACRDVLSLVYTPHAGKLLRAAAASGHVRVVAAAMGLGARVLEGALVAAAAWGRQQVVRLLLSSGADPDSNEPFGACALMEAARNGHTSVVQDLLDAGARIDGSDDTDSTSSTTRTSSNREAPRPQLGLPWVAGEAARGIGGGGSPRGTLHRDQHDVRSAVAQHQGMAGQLDGAYGSSAAAASRRQLRSAASDTLVDVAPNVRGTGLPRRGGSLYDVDSTDADDGRRRQDGGSPPPSPPPSPPQPQAPAGAGARLPYFRSLQPLSPFPSASQALPPPLLLPPAPLLVMWPTPQRRATPLMAACRGGHAGTATLLLSRGARPDHVGGAELMLAASAEVVDVLLAAAPSLSVHLGTALLAAAGGNRLAIVAALLRRGVDAAYKNGVALTEAAYQGHVQVVELLLDAGESRLRSCGALNAAMTLAQRWGRDEVVQCLMGAL